MSNWEELVSGIELGAAARERKKQYVDERHSSPMRESLEAEGLIYVQDYKNGDVKMRRHKPVGERFENRVWLMLKAMGFDVMNKSNSFKIAYGNKNDDLTKQIDVFAYDGETALLVECKASETPGTHKDYKTDIEAFKGIRNGIRKSVSSKFGREVRIKFIWATSNIVLGKDIDRLKDAQIAYFDEGTISYYEGLAKHLGSAAKYQLLGKLFANQEIKNMEASVPAIKGTMGGHVYYSFSIEPERLLKIGYVLHRDDANKGMMPTYQRVIKKSRLESVRNFVNEGGYFPNSVVISVDAPKRGLQFDVKQSGCDSIAKLGVLHLPKKYRSAYIIDGQHRLYGYSDSQYASSNTIPVVAFENLSKEEQIRLFMEINENQKAVSKNLRNTLNADLLWTSDNYNERRRALRLRIAEELGENQSSPLHDRVVIGENATTDTRCITMDAIEAGLRKGKFISSFSGTSVDRQGLFDCADASNDYAFELIPPFLNECFGYIKQGLPNEWELGKANQGIVATNTGIYALLVVVSDFLDYIARETTIRPRDMKAQEVLTYLEPALDAIIEFYKTISPEVRAGIKGQYGEKGKIKHWRHLQKAVNTKIPDFNPSGLEEWWVDNSRRYNDESQKMLEEIAARVKKMVRSFLSEKGLSIPVAVDVELYKLAKRRLEQKGENREIGPDEKWESVNLCNCAAIARHKNYWSEGLKDLLTRPEDKGRRIDKATKIKWLSDLEKIEKNLSNPGYSVTNADYKLIRSINDWLMA